MASHLKLLHGQTTIKIQTTSTPNSKPITHSFSIHLPQRTHHLLSLRNRSQRFKVFSLSPTQDLSSISFTPPSTREAAISQAKFCLSATLKKPLNNPIPLPTRKLKKPSQPRYRIEIPIVDDSPDSLTTLAFEVFSDIPILKKGVKPSILMLWPNATLQELARRAFDSADSVTNSVLASIRSEVLNSSDLAVLLAPEASQLEEIKIVTNELYPKPVVMFNPKWGFDEEKGFDGGLGSFLGSFDVVYSFMGLEVRGILSRRKGVVFKCARDGVVSGDGWVVMVEEEGKKGQLKVVSKFKRRPSIGEVESVLYNLMAANSPVTKSVKFLRDLASNVTRNKAK